MAVPDAHPPKSGDKAGASHWKHLLNIGLASAGFVILHMLLLPIRTKILTYQLEKSAYGVLTLVSTTISLVTMVSSLGTLEFLLRRLPGRDDPYQWSAFKAVTIRFCGFGAVLGLAGIGLFSLWHPAKLQSLSMLDLALSAVLLVLTIHLTQVMHFLMGRSAYAPSRMVQLLYADAWFLPIILVFLLTGPLDITTVLLVWAGWTIFSWLIAQRWAPVSRLARTPDSSEHFREALAFGLPLVPMIAGDWMFRAVPLYLMATEEQVANYGLCFNTAWVGTIIGGAVLDILLTEFFKIRNRIASDDPQRIPADPALRRLFSTMLRYGLVIVIPFGAVIGLASTHVILFLSNEKFLDAAPLLPWLVPVPFLFLFMVVFGRTLMAMHKNAVVGWTTFGAAIANVTLCAFLIPAMGPKGAALANAVTYAVVVAILGVTVRAWRWVELEYLMPIRLLALGALCAAGFLVLARLGAGTVLTLAAGGVWCCGWAFAMGLVRRSDFLFASHPPTE